MIAIYQSHSQLPSSLAATRTTASACSRRSAGPQPSLWTEVVRRAQSIPTIELPNRLELKRRHCWPLEWSLRAGLRCFNASPCSAHLSILLLVRFNISSPLPLATRPHLNSLRSQWTLACLESGQAFQQDSPGRAAEKSLAEADRWTPNYGPPSLLSVTR